MPLKIAAGHSSLKGPRERNEDFCGLTTPEGSDLQGKGILAAVADGIGGHRGGREASEYTVRGLLADYYATPDTWGVARCLETVLKALNRWVISEGQRNADLQGMATTLSGIVLRGTRFHTVHIGDSRIYRLRAGQLEQLTTDHLWEHPELKNVLSRAIGLDPRLLPDFSDGELEKGDRFVLVSDGVWGVLPSPLLAEVLMDHYEPQPAASALTSLALAHGGQDNASAVVLDVMDLPEAGLIEQMETDTRLALPPRLKTGHKLDDLEVLEVLHDSRETLLYKVKHLQTGEVLVLKTLQETLHNDPAAQAALILEEWRARRLNSSHFASIVPSPDKSCLYLLMKWCAGANLEKRLELGHHFAVNEVVQIGMQLMKALSTLHRMDIIHRDIKTDNLILGVDGVLRVLDLGVAISTSEVDKAGADKAVIGRAGTPSYMAPELYKGEAPCIQADLYAAGVTLYRLLTRHYPYGEIEPFQTPAFQDPQKPVRWRPDTPAWLENLLLKGVAVNKNERFETAEEFLLALQRGENRPVNAPLKQPLAARSPVVFWKTLFVLSAIANIVLVYLLIH